VELDRVALDLGNEEVVLDLLDQGVEQERRDDRGWPGGRFGMYLPTVLGDTPIPSLTNSSLAMRYSPHRGFSVAIRRMSCRSSSGMEGRPGRDL